MLSAVSTQENVKLYSIEIKTKQKPINEDKSKTPELEISIK